MWRHVVDKEWMMARTHYLTASSIKNILPVTETGRKRSQAQIEANMMKIASSFATEYISDEDCVATGMAARGHLLEPIAIEEANRVANLGLYHWDDRKQRRQLCIISRKTESHAQQALVRSRVMVWNDIWSQSILIRKIVLRGGNLQ